MSAVLRRYGAYLVVAVLASSLTAGGPSALAAAYDAFNSDKVDGKHAVSAGATLRQRAGKLVATGSGGRLPNNIIAKATNADRLDGLNSTQFQRTVTPRGRVLRGEYGGEFINVLAAAVSFEAPLARGIGRDSVHVIPEGGPFTSQCPGLGNAARGHLCLYERHVLNASTQHPSYVIGADAPENGTSRFGFLLTMYGLNPAELSRLHGEWALRAP